MFCEFQFNKKINTPPQKFFQICNKNTNGPLEKSVKDMNNAS